jgi:hypothetical protein
LDPVRDSLDDFVAVWIDRRLQERWVIRILLVIAVVMTVIQVIQGRRSSKTSGPLPEEVRHLEWIATFVACDSTPRNNKESIIHRWDRSVDE